MARTGRPSKPVALHKLVGSFRADRHNDETTVNPERVDCPAWVSATGQQQWPEVSAMLFGLGILGRPYTVALALLVDALADYIAYSKQAGAEPPVLTSPNGSSYQNPIVSLKNQAWERVLKALREFGMTPSAISGVKSTRDEKPKAGLSAFKLRRDA